MDRDAAGATVLGDPPIAKVRRLHPMLHAGRWLVSDLLSTLAFVAVYAVTDNVAVAVGLAIAIGVGQIAYLRLRGAAIDLMQWMSLGLVVVFGGVTLITDNPVFIMVKPTLVYAAIGAVMLKPAWINRYAPPIALAHASDLLTAFGYGWAALMFATAAANLGLALFASRATWLWFIGAFPLVSKLVLFFMQYAVTRIVVRRRIRAGGVAAEA